MGDEDAGQIQIFRVSQPVPDVLVNAFFKRTPIFLSYLHFPIYHFDAGAQVQEVGAQSHHAGAAAALFHIIQPTEDETGVHLGGEIVKLGHNILDIHAGFRQFSSPQHHVAVAGREVAGIHYIYIVKFLRCQNGVLITGGKLRADIDMDDRVIFLAERSEAVAVIGKIKSRCGADITAGIYMGIDIVGGDFHAVPQELITHGNAQGEQLDIMLLQLLCRQVAGAVRCNLNIHILHPFIYGWWLHREYGQIPQADGRFSAESRKSGRLLLQAVCPVFAFEIDGRHPIHRPSREKPGR